MLTFQQISAILSVLFELSFCISAKLLEEQYHVSVDPVNDVEFLQTYYPGEKHGEVYKSFRKFDFNRCVSLENFIETMIFYA